MNALCFGTKIEPNKERGALCWEGCSFGEQNRDKQTDKEQGSTKKMYRGVKSSSSSSLALVLDSPWAEACIRLEPHGKAGRTSRTQVKQETKFRTHVSGRVQLNTQGLQRLRGCQPAGQCSKTDGAVSNRRNLSHHLEASN